MLEEHLRIPISRNGGLIDMSSLEMHQSLLPTFIRTHPAELQFLPSKLKKEPKLCNLHRFLPRATIPLCDSTPAKLIALSLTLAVSIPIATPSVSALGVQQGLLTNCNPPRLTCVSSQDDAPKSFLEPWEYDGAVSVLRNHITDIVLSDPQASLLDSQPRYLRFEISLSDSNPALLDDLEFYFPADDNIVHFRSARRDQSFDFFKNRRRLEYIRQQAHLYQITVLRNRTSPMKVFETPFDSFGPSAVDVDSLIDNRGLGSRPVR